MSGVGVKQCVSLNGANDGETTALTKDGTIEIRFSFTKGKKSNALQTYRLPARHFRFPDTCSQRRLAAVSFALKKSDIHHPRHARPFCGFLPVAFYTLYAFFIFGAGAFRVGVAARLNLGLDCSADLTGFYDGIRRRTLRRSPQSRSSLQRQGKWFPPEPAKSDEGLRDLAKTNPIILTVIGYGGFAIISWLMTAKPF